MTVANTSFPTLLDQVRRRDPNGAIARVVEVLTRRNALLEDVPFYPGNKETGHVFSSRTAIPGKAAGIGWRRFNEGVAPGKSRTTQVDETCGMLDGFSVVDTDLADLNGDAAAFRASEDLGFVQGFNNEVETAFFYSNVKNAPEEIHGLAPRFNSTTDPGGGQIIKCHAAANGNDCTSIWFVAWGPDTVFGIYPKNMTGGLQHKDLGVQPWDDGTGKKYTAYVTSWKWKLGLCVKDWRYVVRIANIDTEAAKIGAADTALWDSLVKAYHQIQDLRTGNVIIYMNRTVATYLDLQSIGAAKNAGMTVGMVEGKPVNFYRGIPIRIADAITNQEAAI
jgi:hypothetical protein